MTPRGEFHLVRSTVYCENWELGEPICTYIGAVPIPWRAGRNDFVSPRPRNHHHHHHNNNTTAKAKRGRRGAAGGGGRRGERWLLTSCCMKNNDVKPSPSHQTPSTQLHHHRRHSLQRPGGGAAVDPRPTAPSSRPTTPARCYVGLQNSVPLYEVNKCSRYRIGSWQKTIVFPSKTHIHQISLKYNLVLVEYLLRIWPNFFCYTI